MANPGNLLTTKEVAQLLRIHPKQVYRLLARGLPALRVGDEWRYERDRVLSWAGSPAEATAIAGPPPLLAANGDRVVDLLLDALESKLGALLGFVQADHLGAGKLLSDGRVLLAGQHGDTNASESVGLPHCARLHLVTREIGLATPPGARLRSLRGLHGKRLASRPQSAGIRRKIDRALERDGVDLGRAYQGASEHSSHRDVVLAVASGQADLGLTTAAWARSAKLGFFPLDTEAYELAIPVPQLTHALVVALCEASQDLALRKSLRDQFGYDVGHTGSLRISLSTRAPSIESSPELSCSPFPARRADSLDRA